MGMPDKLWIVRTYGRYIVREENRPTEEWLPRVAYRRADIAWLPGELVNRIQAHIAGQVLKAEAAEQLMLDIMTELQRRGQ